MDALRGIAALSVAWFHFTNGHPTFLSSGWLKSSGTFGWLGVEVFFVLSGFVIPYALHRAEFKLENLGRYLVKRLIRLDPPYLATIAIVILLHYASACAPGFQGEPFKFNLLQFLAHLGYANALIGYPWYNPVFWTLGIEFQWYLAAALLYPLFSSSCPWKRWLVFVAFASLPHLTASDRLLFRYLPVFAVGMAVFQYRTGLIRRTEYATLLVLFGAVSGLTLGTLVGLAAAATALTISFWKLRQRWLLGLGAISYSFYLVHVPIGGRVINLAARLPDYAWIKILMLGVAMLVSVGAAFLLWKFVERPAVRWAAGVSSEVAPK